MSLIPQILHNDQRDDRLVRLQKDLEWQGIKEYRLWDIIRDRHRARSISLGHKQIIQWAKENNESEVLVFEDDIKWFSPDAHNYFIENIPKDNDWDIYSGGCYIPYFKENRFIGFTGFHCYIVRQKFYDTFLSVADNIDIDRALREKGDYRLCYPYACVQYNGKSDNAGKHCNYDQLLDGKEIFGVGTFKLPAVMSLEEEQNQFLTK